MDGILPAALEREGIVGATVSVVAGGEVVSAQGYGRVDTAGDASQGVDAKSSLFRIGSISKVFTATIVMQLVESGVLDLDAPVQDVLDFTVPRSFDEPITMRHLLTHTAGFEDELAGLITAPGGESVSLRDAVANDPPAQIFKPGSTPAYSNYSNGLAAYITERVTGVPFDELVQQRIFDPIGMSGATSAQPVPVDREKDMSKGYRYVNSPEVPFEVVSPAPAGAISATATDMGRFMLAQLGDTEPQLMDPQSLDLMHRAALISDDLRGLAAGPVMTLGFFEHDRNGHRVLSHGGDLTAFHAQMEIYPEDGAGIFISLNSSGTRSDSSSVVREELTKGFADRYFPDNREPLKPTTTATDHADAIAGTYQLSRRGETTFIRSFFILSSIDVVSDGAGAMTISAIVDPTGQPARFIEIQPWLWTEVGGDRNIAVDQRDGKVLAIGFDPAFTLHPMPGERAALPIVAGSSLVVLLAFLIAHPLAAIIRRVRQRRTVRPAAWRSAGWAAWIGVLSLVLSALPWSAVASALMTDGPAPDALIIRTGQVLMIIAALGIIPAFLRMMLSLRLPVHKWSSTIAAVTATLAFAGLIFTLLIGGILQHSLSY
uniref:serine hydrolase domain-containing protein n=1 Tax=Paenarthrobacter nicotinovorans TaxID=29320 RepID=UPI003F499B45